MKDLVKLYVAIFVMVFLLIGVISLWNNYFNSKMAIYNLVNKKDFNPDPPKVPDEKEISLIMVGDNLIHEGVWEDARVSKNNFNFYKMIERVKPIIKKHDLAFYNQESILGGTSLGLSTYPRFNSPQEVGDVFIDAGFNLVALANNHTLDRGERAIISSSKYWSTKEDVITAGSYASSDERKKTKIGEKNGITYALLSYTTLTNGLRVPAGKEYLVDVYSNNRVKQDILKYRDKVDLLMVSMHWGTEYRHYPNSSQKNIAKFLAENGVDIVIGHHPHVVQPVEFIGDTLVIYSLGNFLSGQNGIERLTGLMFSVDISKKSGEKIKINNPKAELTYNYKSNNRSKRNYKVYPYGELNDSILPNYEKHYNFYMDIVTSRSKDIEKIFR